MIDTITPRDRVVAAFRVRDEQARAPRKKGRDTATGRFWESKPEGLAPAETELTEAIAAWQIDEGSAARHLVPGAQPSTSASWDRKTHPLGVGVAPVCARYASPPPYRPFRRNTTPPQTPKARALAAEGLSLRYLTRVAPLGR